MVYRFQRSLEEKAIAYLRAFKAAISNAASTTNFKDKAIEATDSLLHELLDLCVGQHIPKVNNNLGRLIKNIKRATNITQKKAANLSEQSNRIATNTLTSEELQLKESLDKYLQEVVSIYTAVDKMVEDIEGIKQSDIRNKTKAIKESCNEGCGAIAACAIAALLAFGSLAVCAVPLAAGAALAAPLGAGAALLVSSTVAFVYALSQGDIEVDDLQAAARASNINAGEAAELSEQAVAGIGENINTLVENALQPFIKNIENPQLAIGV
ncbi:MAG: hypothetical protein K0R73_626 [Candidatus Midichloriaceae bacterium]|jgi:Sec-independent protein translocase protein TatA|nr:hypothetical protein [Candidatus Midichloriaceae bacterium]